MSEDTRATASFYDAIAPCYDAEMDRAENTKLRSAFRHRVAAITGRGQSILDFGCGTGTDAAWYAARGHRVIAYDISAGMVAVLRDRCASGVPDAAITAIAGGLGALLDVLSQIPPVATVAANFAVLNHLREWRPLLGALVPHLTSDGSVVASLLNPFYKRDMTRMWWWKGLAGSLLTGAIRTDGAVTTYRHFRRTVSRMASPFFELSEWRCGSNANEGRIEPMESTRASLGDNFVFVVLRRRR